MDKLLYNAYRFSSANSARIENGNGTNNLGALTSDGRYGFDCSGFVNYLLTKGGNQINNYTSVAKTVKADGSLTAAGAQWQQTINTNQAQQGDLVYFQGHVGIVVSYSSRTGVGVFRSSTSSYGVTDAPFTTGPKNGMTYWGTGSKQFLGFTRVTAENNRDSDIWRSSTNTSAPPPLESAPALPSANNPNPSGYASSWLTQTARIESRGSSNAYEAQNGNALGKYQMLEKGGALTATGYTDAKGNWLGKNGIYSRADFLANGAAQEKAAAAYVEVLRAGLIKNGAINAVGTTIGGYLITEEGLLGAAWQYGAAGVKQRLSLLDDRLDSDNVNRFGFLSRMDSFRGTLAPGMAGASVLAPTGGASGPYTGPVANTAYPGTGTSTHHSNGSITNEFEAKADTADGKVKKGDFVSASYNADGSPSTITVWHTDGNAEQWNISDDRTLQTYVKWDKAGVKQEQLTTRLEGAGQGSYVGEFILGSQRYNENGTPVVEQGQTPPAAIDPSTLSSPENPILTKQDAENEVKIDFNDSKYGLGEFDLSKLPDTALEFVPTGTADQLLAELKTQGFSVEQTENALFAQRDDEYFIISDRVVEIGKGARYGRIDLVNNSLVMSDTGSGTSTRYVLSEIAGKPVLVKGSIAQVTADDAEPDLTTFQVDRVIAIDGNSLANSGTYGLTPDDYRAFGLTFDTLTNGTVPKIATDLITGLDPADLQTNNWAPPQLKVTDLGNGLTQRSIELGNGVTLSSVRNEDRLLISTTSLTPALDEENNPVPNTYALSVKDATGKQTAFGTRLINPIDGNSKDDLYEVEPGSNSATLTQISTSPGQPPKLIASAEALNNIGQSVGAFNDLYSFINQVQTHDWLPAAGNGIRFYNEYRVALDPQALPVLSGVSSGIALYTGLQGLGRALDSGDVGQTVVSLGNVAIGGATLYASLLDHKTLDAAITADVFGGAGSFLTEIKFTLPYLSIATQLINGNVGGAVASAGGFWVSGLASLGPAAGPLGVLASLVLSQIFADIFGDAPPPPSGTASAIFTADGSITLSATGVSGGDISAREKLLSILTAEGGLFELVNLHNARIATDPSVIPVGLIAQRLGAITLGAGPGYGVSATDPATGQDPGLYFDFGVGRPVTADINSPVYFQTIDDYYRTNALARQAIAPGWEVATALAQKNYQLSNAGLSEVERAANLGRLATAIPAGQATEHFNPIGIDLSGDGLGLIAKTASDVYLDIDGTADLGAKLQGMQAKHYLKHTAWLNAQDGLLILDKNINGNIDNGEELFSNSLVKEQSRGLASLVVIDADGNGVIDALDPVFTSLGVWQDKNSNGLLDGGIGEVKNLADLGITSLNYLTGTVTRNGQDKRLSTLTLEADTLGTSYLPKGDGIVLETTDGHISLQVTQFHILSEAQVIPPLVPPPAPGPAPAPVHAPVLHVFNETFSGTDENVPNTILVRGYPGVQGLLDADYVSDGSPIYLNYLGNARHGSLTYDNDNIIIFTPDAFYYGDDAGFDYGVTSSAGSAVAHVTIPVSHVDRPPVINGQINEGTPIYGYNPEAVGRDGADIYWRELTQPGYAYKSRSSYNEEPVYRSVPIFYEAGRADGAVAGQVFASDPDDTVLTWSVVAQGRNTSVTIENSGHWVAQGGAGTGTDAFIARVTDPSGKFADAQVTFTLPFAPVIPPNDDRPPIIVDLNNTGFHFTPLMGSSVFFLTQSDGWAHRTAWVDGSAGKGNGILAFDKYGDGVVHDSSQIVFKDYLATAQTDLEGLAAFDSNHDGQITALDTRYSQLGVWVDANNNGSNNGAGDTGEYRSLSSLGIAAISLSSDHQFRLDNGVTVHGQASFTRSDGTTGQAADVTLPYGPDVKLSYAEGSSRITQVATASLSEPIVVGDGNNLVLGKLGDNFINVGNGNNVISTGDGNDLIATGNGNNSIQTGDGKDVVVLGDGNNTVILGQGPKLVIGGKGNNLIIGAAGGGAGHNLMLGGSGNDVLYAGDGNSVLYGGKGDDTLANGLGYSELIGGEGDDVLRDGGGRADMLGGAGNDTYVVTTALDALTEKANEGTDTVIASISYTLGDNLENLTGSGQAALTLTGNELANQIIGNGAADTLIGGGGNDGLADSGGAATLAGGAGDDTYIITNAAATVLENTGEGYDVVKTSVSYTLPAHVEKLMATGNAALTLTGNDEGITLQANNGGNTLIGGSGNDTIEGGAEADTLRGGAGNDSYILQGGGGRDTVVDSASAADSVLVRGNLTAADISITRSDRDVIISIENTSDALVLKNWFTDSVGEESAGLIESIRFESGAPSLSSASIHTLLDNHAPAANADTAFVADGALDASFATGNVLANDFDADLPYDSRQHLTVTNPGNRNGIYGSLTLAADGSYTYALKSSAENVQALGRNTIASDVFTYTTQDNALDNKTASASLTVAITGANSSPESVADITSVKEDGTTIATGSVLSNDSDIDVDDVLIVATPGTRHGTFGDLNLASDGSYAYSLNNSAANLQGLNIGQQVTDSFTYTATDGLASSTNSLLVMVTGSNDAPVASLDSASLTEDVSVTTTGNLLANDTDVDQGTVLTLANPGIRLGQFGILALAANGQYTYTLNNSANNVQSLTADQQITDSFAYSVTDGLTSSASNLVVTVSGTNDAPMLSADFAVVTEDGNVAATGNVLANDSDVDAGDTLSVIAPGTLHGQYGDLVLSVDGNYTYRLNNASQNVQALGRIAVVTDSFIYRATDDATDGVAISATNLTVTVTGNNDAPVAISDIAAVQEDASLTTSGKVLVNDFDKDTSDVLRIDSHSIGQHQGSYGSLALADDGSYTYTLNNSAASVQALHEGEQVTDSFAYTVTDGLESSTSTLTLTVTGSNDAPLAAGDMAAVQEDASLTATASVLTNDHDIENRTVLAIINPASYAGQYGSLVLASDGSFTYTLTNGANHVQALGRNAIVTDSFSYSATDGISEVSSHLTVTINGSNDVPVTMVDSNSVTRDGASIASGNLLTNDTDVDEGDTLNVAAPGILQGGYGSLLLDVDGSYTYTLDNNAAGVKGLGIGQTAIDSFTYSATDGMATSASVLNITISGSNSIPIAVPDTIAVAEDGSSAATGNVIANDRDPDFGDVLTVVNPGAFYGLYGDLNLAADGSYTYTLDNSAANVQSLRGGQQVTDSFAYGVTDGIGSDSSSLSVTITAGNDVPLTSEDTASVIEDQSLAAIGNVLLNDQDLDAGDQLHVAASSTGIRHGIYGDLTLSADGSYTYALNKSTAAVQALGRDDSVVDTFTYVAQDDSISPLQAASTLSVSVLGVNDDPQAAADTADVSASDVISISGNVLSNDTDIDAGDTLSVTAPGFFHGAYGDLSLTADGSYTYSLNNGAANLQILRGGQQVTDSFVYRATDGLETFSSTLEITLTGSNDAPLGFADAAWVTEDLTLTAVGNVLANDQDPDVDDSLHVVVSSTGIFNGSYGDLTLSANGSYTYALNHSAAAVQALGRDASATDGFAYTVQDDGVNALQATSTLTVTIAGSNDAPLAFADTASVSKNSILTASGNVLVNDSDIDAGDTLVVITAGTLLGSYGSLVLAANGSYTYTLDNTAAHVQSLRADKQVTDSFAYGATDGLAGSASSLTIIVMGTNEVPIAVADTASVKEDIVATVTGNVLVNDTNANFGVVLSVSNPGTRAGQFGVLALSPDGSYVYTLKNSAANVQSLHEGQQVIDSFGYTAEDGLATSASTLTVTITGTNDVPVVFADTSSAEEDVVLSTLGNVLTNDNDPDTGDTLYVAADTTGQFQGIYGNLTLSADGSYSYAFNNAAANIQALGRNTIAFDRFSYAAQDSSNTSLQAASQLTVAIQGSNDGPKAYGDNAAITEDETQPVGGNVLGNDVDPDTGDVLSLANPGTLRGTYGDLVLDANGSYTYALNYSALNVQSLAASQQVTDSFVYTATDGFATANSSVTVTVTGINDAPVAVSDIANVKEDAALSFTGNVLANDSDVDQGSVLSLLNPGVLVGEFGTLTLGGSGAYTYTLNNTAANVQGMREGQQVTDTFAYSASDGLAATVSTLSVTITGSNDAPVVATDTAYVKEESILTAAGNVLVNDRDPDTGDTLHLVTASIGRMQGNYGSLTLSADGSYSYALSNTAVEVKALGRNASVTDTFAYTVQDSGTTPLQASSTLTVTIVGSNDGPQAVLDIAGVAEDANTIASGNVLTNDSDVDAGDTLSVVASSDLQGNLQGIYGNLDLAANGQYSYTLNNTDVNVQSLRGGQRVTDSFAYTATDGLALSASTLTVTVTGANDGPTAVADTTSVKEDVSLTATGNVLTNDKDLDQGTVLNIVNPGTFTSQFGSLTLDANGAYVYTLNNNIAAVQRLGTGQTGTDVFSYTAKDDDLTPLSASSTLSITIAGGNDAPVVASAIGTQAARENQPFAFTVSGATFTDADNADMLTYSAKAVDAQGNQQALPVWLSFNAANRSFTGTPGSAAGGSFDFVVTATDLQGAFASSCFTLNVSDEFTGTGTTANLITGNNANNTLNGVNLNETIIGKAGTDTLYGGAGDDTLEGGTGADLLFGDAGNDTLKFSDDDRWNGNDYAVHAGSPGNPGSGKSYKLAGMSRSLDTFDGGSGIDTLLGTTGDDVIALDVGGQRIKNIEIIDAGAGDDVVDLTSPEYAVSDVTVYAGDGDDIVWASSGNDTLYGGNGNDTMDGGAGADLMEGGAGNDNYTVDNSLDQVIESFWGGTDLVRASVNFTLGSNLENLMLAGSATQGTGNELGNLLTANNLGNTLSGGAGRDTLRGGAGRDILDGGTGADTLVGSEGDDVYLVDDASDAIQEANNEGTDTVNASLSYTLGSNLENLTLTGLTNIAGTGNSLKNLLIGNAAANTLAAGAGDDTLDGKAGNDILIGGTGNDSYLFDRGYGSDTVQENDSSFGNIDVVKFDAGISSAQLWFRKVSNNLEVSIIGGSDKLTIRDWYLGNRYHAEQFKTSDGKTLVDSQVQNLVQAMASFSPPAAGQTSLPQNYAGSLYPVIAANWH